MSEIIDASKALKSELDKLPLFIEFKRVKALFESNKEILELRKQIVRAKNENRMDDYALLKKDFDSNPLVQNYYSLEDEVINYLKEVNREINR